MRRLSFASLAASLLALAPAAAAAQPACVAGTLASYLALGPGGCRINDTQYAAFGGAVLSSTGTVNGTALSASQVFVSPFLMAGASGQYLAGFDLRLAGPVTGAPGTPAYSVAFSFLPSAVGGLLAPYVAYGRNAYGITSGELDSGTVALASNPSAAARAALSTLANGPQASVDAAFAAQFPYAGVAPFRVTYAGTSTAATTQLVSGNTLSVGFAVVAPEPATLALTAAGLAVFGAAARRRRPA